VQVVEIRLQVLPVGLPRRAVHTRCGVSAQCLEAFPEQLDRYVVQERSEPHFLVLDCDLAYTVQPHGHA
jgi:hypothetical protein